MDDTQRDKITDKICTLLMIYNKYLAYMFNVEIIDPDIDTAVGFLNDQRNRVDAFITDIEAVISGAK